MPEKPVSPGTLHNVALGLVSAGSRWKRRTFGAIREIREGRPDAKIVILRDPVDGAHSQYCSRVRDGNELSSFEALPDEPERIKNLRWCVSYRAAGGRFAAITQALRAWRPGNRRLRQ